MKKQNLFFILLFIFSITAFAQVEDDNNNSAVVPDLITDRPDATESAFVVPLKSLQIETGGFYESFEENSIKNEVIGYNTALVRYGLLKNLEVRLGWNFEEGRTSINGQKLDDVTSGFSTLLAGAKIAIAKENKAFPEIALLGHLYLPFLAATDYRPETTGADFRFSFSHTLSEKSSLGYNLGAQWGNDSPEISYIYTLSYGYSISNSFGAYVEVYGDFPEDNKANHLFDMGLTYLVNNNLQLDTTVGTSITKGQDIYLSLGASYRLLNL